MAAGRSRAGNAGSRRRRSLGAQSQAISASAILMGAFFGGAVPEARRATAGLPFAAPVSGRMPQSHAAKGSGSATPPTQLGAPTPFCRGIPRQTALPERACQECGVRRPPVQMAAGAMAAPLSWMNRWRTPPSPSERLSPREWTRMYRTLGIPEDSSKEQVLKATVRLRRKYENSEEALERVESANLWIMTRMVSRNEEALRQRQQANRMRELGDSPRRLFQKYIAGYVPPSVRQMMETPSTKHFRWTSALLGIFALMALCVPTQATNFVGLGAASALGLIYQRNRPEPVKDDFGNVGEVRKVNGKEMLGAVVVVALGCIIGTLFSLGIGYLVDTPFQVVFAVTTCSVLWLVALFFKVYQCFDN